VLRFITNQHASKHARAISHPVIASAQPASVGSIVSSTKLSPNIKKTNRCRYEKR